MAIIVFSALCISALFGAIRGLDRGSDTMMLFGWWLGIVLPGRLLSY